MLQITRHIIALILAFGCVTPSQAGVLALDHTRGSGSLISPDLPPPGFITAGWAFSTSSTVTVDGLGFFNWMSDGLRTSHAVGLWSNAGVLLTSAFITNVSSPVASTSALGRWLFEDVAPVLLLPGDYLIGASFFEDSLDRIVSSATVTTISQVTYEGSRFGLGFGPPIANAGGGGDFGPTFSVLQVELAEPGSIALIGIALAGLGFSRRKRAVH